MALPSSSMCSEDFGGSLRELWVRAAATGGGAGAPGVRLGRSHITRRHEAPRWGGTSLYMWKRNNCPCLSLLGASNVRWSGGNLPPLRLCIPPSLQSERASSAKVAAGLSVPKEPQQCWEAGRLRAATPGRRGGQRSPAGGSVRRLQRSWLLRLTGTDTKRAIITQQSEQIHVSQTFRMDFTALKHRLHLKYCKF